MTEVCRWRVLERSSRVCCKELRRPCEREETVSLERGLGGFEVGVLEREAKEGGS